jgi:hypothetical protein
MMHSRSRLLLLVLLLVAGTLALPWAASAQEPVTSRLKLSIGGYIKPEIMYRTNSGAIGAGGNSFGISNFGFAAIAAKNNGAGATNGTFSIQANESRLGFSITAPDWRGLKSTAYLETDFAGNSAAVVDGYCQAGTFVSTSQCFAAQNSAVNPETSGWGYGMFRLRHAYFRLAGEGLGGSWNVTFGQTWGIFGMLPYYSGSSLSFGGASVFGQRMPQLSLSHTLTFAKDFQWVNTIGLVDDTTHLNEAPAGEISSRFIYAGWQGWNGGARAPTHLGISARIDRQKADLYQNGPALVPFCQVTATNTLTGTPMPAGFGNTCGAGLSPTTFPTVIAPPAATNSGSSGNRSLSATSWGLTGGIFLPILPGTSATDRTWALSVVSEGGYGEGINDMIPGANPLPGAVTIGANERGSPGAAYFNPGKCTFFNATHPFNAFAGPPGTNLNGGGFLTPAAAAACNNGNMRLGPDSAMPTQLSLINSAWASYNVQFYLPWNFWISGGQKWMWFTNGDNAVAQTCLDTRGIQTCNSTLGLVAPVAQGRWNSASNTLVNNSTSLYTSRDSLIKRLTYTYVTLFYDMTPNVRLGFEYGLHGTNRKDSAQDNQSNRFQFGAYYFF